MFEDIPAAAVIPKVVVSLFRHINGNHLLELTLVFDASKIIYASTISQNNQSGFIIKLLE